MSTTLPQIALPPSTQASALAPFLNSAAFAPLNNLGWIRVTGSDRVRWLNGMVTNSIQTLKPGEGCYNFALNAQGRIQADLTAFAWPEELLLQSDRDRLPALIALLDRFIIMDDVELTEVGDWNGGVALAGPEALTILRKLDLVGSDPAGLTLSAVNFQGKDLRLIHAHSPLVPRYELWSDHTHLADLTSALIAAGASPVTPEALDHLRILEGTPLYGTDIRNSDAAKDLPQETATISTPSRALHFAKGCYLGQEIVERIRSRGNVHRTFSGFILTGDVPAAGATIASSDAPDKPLGELTSVAALNLPSGPITLALGYIRREALERNQPLIYPGGQAIPSSVPFPAALSHLTQPASDQ